MEKQPKCDVESRRAERRPVELRGFALSDGRDADVVISDMSYEGCQIRSEEPFSPGEIIELRILRRGRAHAQICWAVAGAAGARFLY